MTSTMQVEISSYDPYSLDNDFHVAKSPKNEEVANSLALFALRNNQWAEVLTMAAERLHDGDWRTKNVVETF